jgi:phosphate transport system permease protein
MSQAAITNVQRLAPKRPGSQRQWKNRLFVGLCIAAASVSLATLAVLLLAVVVQGVTYLDWGFINSPPNPAPAEAGVRPALFGTIWVCLACALFALPIGVGTAILLEEFKPKHPLLRLFHSFVQLNITNLAGVPSVVYGILGLTAFVNVFGLFGKSHQPAFEFGVRYYDQFLSEGDRVLLVPVAGAQAAESRATPGLTALTGSGRPVQVNVVEPRDALPDDTKLLAVTLRTGAEPGRISRKSWYYLKLPLGRSVLAGSLTLMLVVLPIVIISSQEALRAVPDSLREGALGMGATRWQMVRNVTLPSAVPGIMTGSILAMSRAIGEAAPLLIIAGIIYISAAPQHLMDDFTVMPLQIYNWAQRPQKEFHDVAASGIIVLLALLLTFNAIAVFIRQRMQRQLS